MTGDSTEKSGDQGNDDRLVISEEDLDQSSKSAPAQRPAQEAVTQPLKITPKTAKAGAAAASQPSTADGGGRFSGRRLYLILGGAAVAALVGGFVAAALIVGIFDSDETRTVESLAESNAAFASVTTQVRGAAANEDRPLTALREASDSAAGQATTVSSTATELEGSVDDGELANPALALMSAQEGFLESFSEVADFSDQSLKAEWKELLPELEQVQNRINAAAARVEELELSEGESVIPDSQQVQTTVDAADAVLSESDRLLSRWRAAKERFLEEQRQAQQAVETYKPSMSGLMDEYFDQRDETRALMEARRVLWFEAQQVLTAHAEARGAIISQMSGLPVPPGAESAHSEMVSLATESKGLLEQAASDALTDPDIDWTGSPGYLRLDSASDQITGRFEPARQAVLNAADAAAQEANSGGPPMKPRL